MNACGKGGVGLQLLIDHQWTVFITLEVLSFISLLLFGVFRYGLNKRKFSNIAIFMFLFLLIAEVLLGVMIYQETKEFSSFQIIIGIFVLYACTFGIFDFIKLDRWMRRKVGKWRQVELLTEKDYRILNRQKDSKYVARRNRISSMIHLFLFVVGQFILWSYGTENFEELLGFLTDFSWIEAGTYEDSPYPNEMSYSIGMIWGIVFIVDFIYSWSYTVFPSKTEGSK